LVVACLTILKVFIIPGCLGFDFIDEGNHTFVNLFAARSVMADGDWPLMNLFNNFGTPLIGDAITYPFAIQSIPYYFLSGPVAMTFNRFWIASTTIIVLTLYFKRYVSRPTASFLAVLVFVAPGFLWHFAHHHYQSFLLCFVLVLLFQERFSDSGRLRHFALLFMALILLVLSTSINLVTISLPFLFMNMLVCSRFRFDRRIWLFLTAFACALLFYYPEILAFAKAIPRSARAVEGFGTVVGFRDLFLGVAGPVGDAVKFGHDKAVHHFISLPVLMLAGWGIGCAAKKFSEPYLVIRLVVLGMLPFVGVLFLMYNRELYWSIPLLKSTDITRFWWLSNIWLFLGMGKGLERIRRRGIDRRSVLILGVVYLVAICFYQFILGWGSMPFAYRLPQLFFLLILVMIFAAFNLKWAADWMRARHALVMNCIYGSMLLGVLLCFIPPFAGVTGSFDMSTCRTSHYYSSQQMAVFQPADFLPQMEPFSRLATELYSSRGQDLKALTGDIFGSNGRSVLLNKALADYLISEDLVMVEQVPLAYHFKRPWDKEKLSRLGIRYVMQIGMGTGFHTGENLLQSGWKPVTHLARQLFLLEQPDEVCMAYLLAGNEKQCIKKEAIQYIGNSVYVDIPAFEGVRELVLTFMHLPEWQARVDKRARPLHHGRDQMLRVFVTEEDERVHFEYAPFYRWQIGLGALLSILIAMGMFAFLRKKEAG